MFLLDTNVISELRKISVGKGDRTVEAWATGVPIEVMFLSTVTILELEIGVLQIERRDAHQGMRMRTWFEKRVLEAFKDRLLDIDVAVVRRCASLHVPDPRPDRDALIAATGLVHDLTVVTRNVADFAPTGVRLINPWLIP
jgi:hypothetical protein